MVPPEKHAHKHVIQYLGQSTFYLPFSEPERHIALSPEECLLWYCLLHHSAGRRFAPVFGLGEILLFLPLISAVLRANTVLWRASGAVLGLPSHSCTRSVLLPIHLTRCSFKYVIALRQTNTTSTIHSKWRRASNTCCSILLTLLALSAKTQREHIPYVWCSAATKLLRHNSSPWPKQS